MAGLLPCIGDPSTPRWGEPFNHPTCAADDADGGFYVTDGYGNSSLHRFDADRRLRYSVGTPGPKPGQFSTPHDVLVTHGGRVLVVDRENNRVQCFDSEGRVVGQMGVDTLYKPMAIAETPDGEILVTDQTPRLHLFSAEGELLGRCRTLSAMAHGVAAAPDGSIYLAEMAPDMLTRLVPVG